MKCCDITAGMLREPVTFHHEIRTSDGAGGFTKNWAAISGAPDKGALKAASGYERWASDRIESQVSIRLTVRYFAGLKEIDSVIIRAKRYNIRFIENVEFADRWLSIDLNGGVAT